ncbi:MAG: HsdR family type I site-specific deoxyribonuclease [Cytophagales bacterium]|nr:HsdR family type I site-specific deoxyribonuclease [Cytophagales bacterium]MCA6369832.1 HsdR family type I site-specific deoxyribonuclease [Cytophagales bacterium]MCA6374520.1 HsdR family type I site-specific deoxyribonuclease [Cytophagales bacterium]
MSKPITENIIEESAIEILQSQGWEYANGKEISPEGLFCERENYSQIVLVNRLRSAIAKINPAIPSDAQEAAIQKVLRIYSPVLLHNNEEFHKLLVEKVKIPYQQNGYERSHEVALIDFENTGNNQFLIVNQYTIIENNQNKRPDVLLFVNGLPLVVIELKNAASENADIKSAYQQIQTYKAIIPSLFTYNAICILSDGLECKAGSVSADLSRYMTWKTADGIKEASRFKPQLETLMKGMLQPATLLDLVRNFIVFEKSKKEDAKTGLIQIQTVKKLAAYHQYYAVNKAVQSTIRASGFSLSSAFLPSLEGSGVGTFRRKIIPYNPKLTERAKELRQNMTLGEVALWNEIKQRKLGFDFDRQRPIDNFIVDFYCKDLMLAIEIDGDSHSSDEAKRYDANRQEILESLGVRFMRFDDMLVRNQVEKVVAEIRQWIDEKKHDLVGRVQPTPNPSKEGNNTIGDKRGGVVWHTQGSGKSLSMVFYSGKLITSPEMQNPTIVVITDRNDLDDQLFDTFASSVQLLRQEPIQAESRDHLKELLKVASGGIVFTTIQKFLLDPSAGSEFPRLSDRRNIVVIADEAHRTQYGLDASYKDVLDKQTKEVIGKRIAYGFAKYMRDALPNATYIGFTGTPIEGTDVNTPQVFGNYIDRYDIKDAVDDGATVKIFYESRLAKVNLDDEGRRLIEEFDRDLEQDEEVTEKQKAKAKWTKLEAIVGNQDRVKNLAKDIVAHFEKRQTVFEGKAMIVAMSRRIAADLYAAIIALRPQWHNDDKTKGFIKVVMTTNSADGPEISKHHTTKQQRKDLSERMKDPADELKLVIVRDMWLTGFDAPCLNTMYVDKPMRGHNLMQAIARVNRVFKDKSGGLIVDYLGIGTDLKKALSFYGQAGGKGDPAQNIDKAFEIFEEKLEIIQQMFNEESQSQLSIASEIQDSYYKNSYKFNYRRFFQVSAQEKLSIILQTEEHILGLKDGKERFIREVSLLSQALSLCITKDEVQPHLPEVAFFQAVKARLAKFDAPSGGGRTNLEIETAIKQIIDEALSSDKVIDIFEAAGIDKPEISGLEILSEEFLMEVEGMQHKNLAIELLKKILNNELKARAKTNLVKSKKLLEMLEGSIKRYQNNLLTTAEIIQELIAIAKQIKEADKEGEKLGLNNDEVAFYNALEINDSAVQVLGDDTLKEIAREIADKVRANATIDWTIRESARAKLMVLVRRTLNKWGYPPDKQQKAIDTVLRQAELLADNLTA